MDHAQISQANRGNAMLLAIKHGLTNLWNFSGRDARQAFWFYVLFIYLITMGIGMIVSIPMTMQGIMSGVQQGMAHPGDPVAAQAATQAAMAEAMGDFIPALLWTSMASAVILLLGLSAAFVRRLHDSGLPGYLALIPAACQIVGIALLPSQMETMREMMLAQMTNPFAAFSALRHLGIGALAGWAAIVFVIALGVRKSTDGPNRYGETPFVA